LDLPAAAEVYLPFTQSPVNFMSLVVRTAGNPAATTSSVRNEVRALDKSIPLQTVATMDQLEQAGVNSRRLPAALIGLFAGLALVLAIVGIHGVIAYSVSQRTSEIGIRMALGAKRIDVLRLVVAQGLKPVLTGLLMGVVAALALSRTLAGVLYGVHTTDPLTFSAVLLLFLIVGTIGCAVPAWRAARIDPLVALRHE
jgi:putative ABC transport system permease protein